MLDKSSMVRGLAGTPIYSGNSVYGMMTPEQYINSKFGLSVNEANWNSNRVKFERDLIAGNIPNVGVTPTNKVLIENGIPGDEQFTQEYKAYVPVQYFIDNGYDFGETDPEKLIKNEDFNKFLSTLMVDYLVLLETLLRNLISNLVVIKMLHIERYKVVDGYQILSMLQLFNMMVFM